MKEILLCKYGEIVLKGANRRYFEDMLGKELRFRAASFGNFSITWGQSTIYIEPKDDFADLDGMFEAARRLFGIAGVVRAAVAEKNMESILSTARSYLPPFLSGKKTFKVEAKRSDKAFPLSSPEISREAGGAILSVMPHLRVDVHNPEVTVRVEVRETAAYVHAGQFKGAGGLPVGAGGKGLLLLSGGIDSPVAGWMMAKRGVKLEALYFESMPYTSEQARQKVLDLAGLVARWAGSMQVNVISLTHIQEELVKHGDLEYLKQQKEYLVDLLKLLFTKVDERGVEQLDSRFLDWPSNAHPEAIHAGLQSLMLIAMQSGSELCEILGEDALAEECRQMYEKMKAAAPIVCDTYFKSGKATTAPGNKQGAALLTIAGLMDAKEANDKVISVDGGHGFSTFYGYYMLQAMAKAGNYEGAMQIIRDYWGAMLDLGATSFWEDFDLDWMENAARIDELVPEGKVDVHRDKGAYCYVGYRHSFCHGWASGPTAWLSQHVLGVEVLEPGCKKVRITPHLGDLEWVEGSFPTPYGKIEISHCKSADGKVVSKIKAPKGVKVVK